jgi:RNA polymerase sigma-70 factor (ECF subfamily)
MSAPIEDFSAVLRAARAGEAWAFACLYDRLQPPMVRYLRWREPSLADDLASETWLAVAERLATFDGEETAFRGWVFTIARRRLADHRRQAARRRTSPAPQTKFAAIAAIAADTDPADLVGSRLSAQAAIERLTELLPGDQAEVVVLRVVGGLPVEEVARILGKRPGHVRVLQHRALRRLATRADDLFLLEA